MILCRQLVHEIEAKAIERRVEDETWYRKQELLQDAEEQRRKILIKEEEKLAEQRRRYRSLYHPMSWPQKLLRLYPEGTKTLLLIVLN